MDGVREEPTPRPEVSVLKQKRHVPVLEGPTVSGE